MKFWFWYTIIGLSVLITVWNVTRPEINVNLEMTLNDELVETLKSINSTVDVIDNNTNPRYQRDF